jgi:hypothetical protein
VALSESPEVPVVQAHHLPERLGLYKSQMSEEQTKAETPDGAEIGISQKKELKCLGKPVGLQVALQRQYLPVSFSFSLISERFFQVSDSAAS